MLIIQNNWYGTWNGSVILWCKYIFYLWNFWRGKYLTKKQKNSVWLHEVYISCVIIFVTVHSYLQSLHSKASEIWNIRKDAFWTYLYFIQVHLYILILGCLYYSLQFVCSLDCLRLVFLSILFLFLLLLGWLLHRHSYTCNKVSL